ncbi:response regulator [Mariprofundus erugo]|uniref:Chemotaxis protein CheA n=1 Tax=Mariprofundus erugo TaxID=2528639 RepID=A0A5R9GSG1_9PROT|nr:chemotaxis protein CheW [Mariprofundus erugo]TLS67995.1 response regulator [Mariprofundus erugo]
MDEELLSEFLTESNENMASIEEQLMELEANPGDEELVNAIFRIIHTVKGSCGFIGLTRLEKVAHAGENLLGKVRALKFQVNDDIVSLLLSCADAINAILDGLQSDGVEPDIDHSALIRRLQAAERLVEVMAGSQQPAAKPVAAPAAGKKVAPQPVVAANQDSGMVAEGDITPEMWLEGFDDAVYSQLRDKGWLTPSQAVAAGFAALRELDALTPADALKILGAAKAVIAAGGIRTKAVAAEPEAVEPDMEEVASVAAPAAAPVAPEPLSAPPPALRTPPEVKVEKEPLPAVSAKEVEKGEDAAGRKPAAGAGSIRVDVELLDSLMNQVGELVLTRNRLVQMVAASGSMEFMRVGREVDQVTERLQAQLLRTRMQPIKTIWGNMPRVVRDISKQLQKQIVVEMEGEETELDRTILNALKDPLTHIIRNSCDHGIEPSAVRIAAGKPAVGTIRLNAAQESGYIVILIEDDGAGIPADKVKAKAVAMGVITEDEAAAMNDKVALQLIFNAGLSTAETVSNFSGRGVGMDVVRTEIEKVGGSVDISSTIGSGTTLRIRIPLTLAIISAMIIGCRERRFAVPQISIRELLSAPATSEEWRMIGDQPFFRLRGRLLPVLDLASTLQLDQQRRNAGSIVVIDAGERSLGLLVDTIFGSEEIVVKPLGIHFRNLSQYGGCSILGDGAVIPILDCNGLAQMMKISDEMEASARIRQEEEIRQENDLQHVLLFTHADGRYAIPMALIERLEHFPRERIERSGSSEVLQYRHGEVIRVLRWGDLIGQPDELSEEVYGLILSDGDHRMCLQVNEIEDIIEVPLEIKKPVQDEFFLGTAVIQNQVAEVVDVFDVIKRAVPDWFKSKAGGASQQRSRILFAEDTPFFRNLVLPVLESMHFEVWIACDGEQAKKILEERVPDIVLTDLEMPKMNGYELAGWIRSNKQLQHLPVVALTATPPDENDEEQRRNFDEVLVKFDRHSLVEHLRDVLASHAHRGQPPAVEDAQIISGEVTR